MSENDSKSKKANGKKPRSEKSERLSAQARARHAESRNRRHAREMADFGAEIARGAKAFAGALEERDSLDLRDRPLPLEQVKPDASDVWASAELIAQAGVNAPTAAMARALFEQAFALCKPFLPESAFSASEAERKNEDARRVFGYVDEAPAFEKFSTRAIARWALAAAELNKGEALAALHEIAQELGVANPVRRGERALFGAVLEADAWRAAAVLAEAGGRDAKSLLPMALEARAWRCAESLWAILGPEGQASAAQDGLWAVALNCASWGGKDGLQGSEWAKKLIAAGADPFERKAAAKASRKGEAQPAGKEEPARNGWMEPLPTEAPRAAAKPAAKRARDEASAADRRKNMGWAPRDAKAPSFPAAWILGWACQQDEKSFASVRGALDAIDWATAPPGPPEDTPVGIVLREPGFGLPALNGSWRAQNGWAGRQALEHLSKKGLIDLDAPTPANIAERALALMLDGADAPFVWALDLHGRNLLRDKKKPMHTPFGAPSLLGLARAARFMAEKFKAAQKEQRCVFRDSQQGELDIINLASLAEAPQLATISAPWTTFARALRAYEKMDRDFDRKGLEKKAAAAEAIELAATTLMVSIQRAIEAGAPGAAGGSESAETAAGKPGGKSRSAMRL
jgi:hypothetical protein